MATVLVVDDSPVDRHRVGSLLNKQPGLTAVFASTGEEALAAIRQQLPDVVVTDLRMPGMNGLELVEAIKGQYPFLPVILMTAFGSEDIATLALQRGAASYVPKRNLARQVSETVTNVLEVTQARHGQQRLLQCLVQTETVFDLDNDLSLIPLLVGHLRAHLMDTKRYDENDGIRVGMALREALINAVHHGNLELSSELLKENAEAYTKLLEERCRQAPYRDRHVHVRVRETRDQLIYVIRDEGPGFNPARLPHLADPAGFDKLGDRGLRLIRTFMDEVRHNETGNEITLIKRRRS